MLAARIHSAAETSVEVRPDRASARLLRDLLSLTKPRVTSMVVLTALGGACLAPEPVDTLRLLVLLGAIALLVGSANTLNCYLERDSDKYMARTCKRALPAGRIEPQLALLWGLGLALAALPALAWSSNALTLGLGVASLVSYVCVYTPLKRRSPWALHVGALPGALPPLMGFTAVHGRIGSAGVWAFLLLLIWQIPHFLSIAIVRRSEYARAGLRAWPVVWGDSSALRHLLGSLVGLVVVSALASWLGVVGSGSALACVSAAAAWLAYALAGVRRQTPCVWARRNFLASLVYLSTVVAALLLDNR